MDIPEVGSLNKVLEHLPLPKHGYYYDENVVANLLSLGRIADEFRVSMDTDIEDAIYVHGEDGRYLRFKRKGDLYCMNICLEEEKENCFFSTVKGRKAMFSELDCKQAADVRSLQERLGYPLDADLAKAI